jgi:hypothetical protein
LRGRDLDRCPGACENPRGAHLDSIPSPGVDDAAATRRTCRRWEREVDAFGIDADMAVGDMLRR